MAKVKFKDIATFINGDRGKNYPSQKEMLETGEYLFINAGHIDNNELCLENMNYISKEKYDSLNSGKIQANDILYCLRGSLGKKAVVRNGINGAIASSLVIIRLDDSKAYTNYIMYALDSPQIIEQQDKANNGSSQPNLSASSVKEYEIILPPLETQRQIAANLDKVTHAIDLCNAILEKLDLLVKSRFVEMFGDFMENPFNWNISHISDISLFLKSGLSRKLSDTDIGIPCIRSCNIQNGQFIYSDIKYWYIDDPQGANISDYILDDGDILINFINSNSQIGKVCVFNSVDRDCIYTTNIFRMKLNERCNKVFFNYYAMTEYYKRQLQNIIQPAVNQSSFTTVNFLKLQIPIPPIELQKEFAAFVEQTNKSKSAVKQVLEQAETLKKALMQEYFG